MTKYESNNKSDAADTELELNAKRQTVAKFHVVLYQPEIPPNTGNIGRTCVALQAKLWLIRPIGFQLDGKHIRRSGLDYWEHLEWEAVDCWEDLCVRLPSKRFWMVTKFGELPYYRADFREGDALVIGSESSGIPQSIREQWANYQISLPMPGPVRCLNQASSATVVMYELAKQIGLLEGVGPR